MKKNIKKYISGEALLLISVLFANVINLIFNIYISRSLSYEEFGIITLISTFLYVVSVPFSSLQATLNHRIAYLNGQNKHWLGSSFAFYTRKKVSQIALMITIAWIVVSPIINSIFQINNVLVPLLFTPILFFGTILAINKGYFQGNFNFKFISQIIIIEAIGKFLFTWLLIFLRLENWVYISIPLSIVTAYILSLFLLGDSKKVERASSYKFPKQFFAAVMISGISTVAFFTFDLLLAKHFLSPLEAGQYSFLSLIGKMVYFFGILPSYLLISIVSRDMGKNRNPRDSFYKVMGVSTLLSCGAYIGINIFGKILLPIVFGEKVYAILPYLNLYSAGIALLTLTATITSYHLAKKQYVFTLTSIAIAFLMVLGIIQNHQNISQISHVIFSVGLFGFITITLFHLIETSNKHIFIKKLVTEFI